MPNPTSQPLSIVVDVVVEITATQVSVPQFNQGLIVGPSTIIPTYGVNPRIRQYTSLTQMSQAGFSSSNPEYVCAELYFGQTPAPLYLWIGRQDATAINTATVDSGGSGYAVGNIITVVQGGAQGGELQVTSVSSGAVTGLAIVPQNQGTGYSVATNLTTTTTVGTGTGCTVNITVVGETPLQALTACRIAQPAWWSAMVTTAVTADNEAIALYAQSAQPPMCYFYTTSDAAVVNGTAGNIFLTLQAAEYNRAFGIYSTTQSGAYPNNQYSCAAAMGVAMGLNTGLANSYFIMKFKTLAGIVAEPLTQAQINNIENANGNVYLSYANGDYNWLEQGILPSGEWFDQLLNIDVLVADLQISETNLLVSQPAVPLTNAGGNLLASVANGACQRAVTRGYISPGTWNGQNVLNLTAGMALPSGYLVQFQNYNLQTEAQRIARQAMPLYIALIQTDGVQSLVISCYIQG
jgi:hypothetical protein